MSYEVGMVARDLKCMNGYMYFKHQEKNMERSYILLYSSNKILAMRLMDILILFRTPTCFLSLGFGRLKVSHK